MVLAAKGESDERLAEEAADLLFHLVVALHQRGREARAVLEVLERRRRSGEDPRATTEYERLSRGAAGRCPYSARSRAIS